MSGEKESADALGATYFRRIAQSALRERDNALNRERIAEARLERVEAALRERIEAWEHDAESAELAGNSYRGYDEDAAVTLFRQASRSRQIARVLREVLAVALSDVTPPSGDSIQAPFFGGAA
jgi:hypothetical protein